MSQIIYLHLDYCPECNLSHNLTQPDFHLRVYFDKLLLAYRCPKLDKWTEVDVDLSNQPQRSQL